MGTPRAQRQKRWQGIKTGLSTSLVRTWKIVAHSASPARGRIPAHVALDGHEVVDGGADGALEHLQILGPLDERRAGHAVARGKVLAARCGSARPGLLPGVGAGHDASVIAVDVEVGGGAARGILPPFPGAEERGKGVAHRACVLGARGARPGRVGVGFGGARVGGIGVVGARDVEAAGEASGRLESAIVDTGDEVMLWRLPRPVARVHVSGSHSRRR